MKTVEAKIVVLGPQGAGKTSVTRRYVDKLFSIDISPTIGASFFSCKVNVDNNEVRLQVWDTAGQERFKSLTPMYYRNANAALLVYDISSYESFMHMQSWLKELSRRVDSPFVICVIGNKCDLENLRAVTPEEALAYAKSIQGTYFETSALDDKGINEAFQHIATSLIRLQELGPNGTICMTPDDGDSAERNGTYRSASIIQLNTVTKRIGCC